MFTDAGIHILERVEGRAVQSPGSDRAKPGRSESGLRSGRVVGTPNEPPSAFVSREGVRLEIMTSSNDGVPRGPNEGDERKSGHPVGTNHRSRPRIDDGDGAAVTPGACLTRRAWNGIKWARLRM